MVLKAFLGEVKTQELRDLLVAFKEDLGGWCFRNILPLIGAQAK